MHNYGIQFTKLYLLTYLIGPNYPINGLRPTATHPSRCPCFLRANASWPHQSMTVFSGFGTSNGYKVVLFADFRRSRRSLLLHTNDMTEPAQLLDINMQHHVYVVKQFIKLTIKSNAKMIANSHWTEDTSKNFPLEVVVCE